MFDPSKDLRLPTNPQDYPTSSVPEFWQTIAGPGATAYPSAPAADAHAIYYCKKLRAVYYTKTPTNAATLNVSDVSPEVNDYVFVLTPSLHLAENTNFMGFRAGGYLYTIDPVKDTTPMEDSAPIDIRYIQAGDGTLDWSVSTSEFPLCGTASQWVTLPPLNKAGLTAFEYYAGKPRSRDYTDGTIIEGSITDPDTLVTGEGLLLENEVHYYFRDKDRLITLNTVNDASTNSDTNSPRLFYRDPADLDVGAGTIKFTGTLNRKSGIVNIGGLLYPYTSFLYTISNFHNGWTNSTFCPLASDALTYPKPNNYVHCFDIDGTYITDIGENAVNAYMTTNYGITSVAYAYGGSDMASIYGYKASSNLTNGIALRSSIPVSGYDINLNPSYYWLPYAFGWLGDAITWANNPPNSSDIFVYTWIGTYDGYSYFYEDNQTQLTSKIFKLDESTGSIVATLLSTDTNYPFITNSTSVTVGTAAFNDTGMCIMADYGKIYMLDLDLVPIWDAIFGPTIQPYKNRSIMANDTHFIVGANTHFDSSKQAVYHGDYSVNVY